MKVLIVEDETSAYEYLSELLSDMDESIEIVANTEGVQQTVRWLESNPSPDLIMMDIHLSDGSAFAIFDRIKVETPIIFTTAYDRYAIDAFKVNSIDYLLKPVKPEALNDALEKFRKLTRVELKDYLERMSLLKEERKYKDKMLVPYDDRLIPVSMKDISCFYTSDKSTRIYLRNGEVYPYAKTLEQIAASLDPDKFIRANKQYIVAKESVIDITVWYDSRLRLTLDVEVPEYIYISKNRAAEFKTWITNE